METGTPRTSPHCQMDRKRIPNLRLPHRGFKFIAVFTATGQRARLEARTGTDRELFSWSLSFRLFCTQKSRHAACAIAGDFRLRTIGVEQSGLHVRVRRWEQPFHTVRAYPVVSITNLSAELRDIGRNIPAIDDQKVIAAGIGLNIRNSSFGTRHSGCTSPSGKTLSSTEDFRNACSTCRCSRCVPSRSN